MMIKRISLISLCAALLLQQPVAQAVDIRSMGAKVFLGLSAAACSWLGATYAQPPKETRRIWPQTSEILKQLDPKTFGSDFKWGVATSGLQVEGDSGPENTTIRCNISRWIDTTQQREDEKKRWAPMENASGFWEHYKEQIPMIKQHLGEGMSSFRLSVPLSKIQRPNGKVWQEGIDHYVDVIKELQKKGIQPTVTFFHHEWSTHFDDKDHFLKEENIQEYVDAYKPLIDALHAAGVRHWMPLNEPAGYALGAFVDGRYPPGKKLAFNEARAFTKNILDAHAQLYTYIHSKDTASDKSEVGIAHAFVLIDPYNRYNPLDVLLAKTFDKLTNDVTLDYLTTGKFTWPLDLRYETNEKVVGTLDFIGVNYYSHVVLGNFKEQKRSGNEILFADNGKEVYAEGFERAIAKADAYSKRECFKDRKDSHIPLRITENGSNVEGETRRTYIARHLLVLQEAIKKGCDIRGYDWWGFVPYYGWGNKGAEGKYPHIITDQDDKTKVVGIRPGSEPFIKLVKDWHDQKHTKS